VKTLTLFEPQFVEKFACVGSACPEHCCGGWNIQLDKKSANRYLQAKRIDIRALATEHISVTKKSVANWAQIKLDASGQCGFLDEKKLCKIHAGLGASALSHTCSTYPRVSIQKRRDEFNTLTLSCPEAARLLLTHPDGMQVQEKQLLRQLFNSAPEYQDAEKLLNLMCSLLMAKCGVQVEQGLYAIALLCLKLDKVSLDNADDVAQLENTFLALSDSLEKGEVVAHMHAIEPHYLLHYALLNNMQHFIQLRPGSRGFATFSRYLQLLNLDALQDQDDASKSQLMAENSLLWQQKVLPLLQDSPWLIGNYFQYRIYHDRFPSLTSREPLSALYLLTSEWLMIKNLLVAQVKSTGELSQDDVVNIIYSFHSLTKHNKQASDNFYMHIDAFKMNDNISLLHLLK
jgi:lysine-N-methylase